LKEAAAFPERNGPVVLSTPTLHPVTSAPLFISSASVAYTANAPMLGDAGAASRAVIEAKSGCGRASDSSAPSSGISALGCSSFPSAGGSRPVSASVAASSEATPVCEATESSLVSGGETHAPTARLEKIPANNKEPSRRPRRCAMISFFELLLRDTRRDKKTQGARALQQHPCHAE